MTEQHTLIPMSPGEALRDGRETRGWSREDMAERLKCSVEIIDALEADEDCPGLAPIYRRGFMKRYADLVELSADQTESWRDNKVLAPPELKPVFQTGGGTRSADRWLRATSYVLASLLVGTLAWQITHEAVRLTQNNETDSDATTTARQTAAEAGNSHVNASIAALESLRPSGSRTGTAGRSAWAALHQPQQTRDLEPGEHLIQLTTSADSWVEIRDASGGLIEQDLVRGGSARQYHARGPYRITLGRSSAVELFVDGDMIDLAPHTEDDVTQMVLDPATLTPLPEDGS